jgi:DNA replication protein DnaC
MKEITNEYAQLMNNLQALKLTQFQTNLDTYIELINSKKKDIVGALLEITNAEIEVKNKRAMNACVKTAGFPFIKRFEDFDFTFQPTINKEEILDFKYLRFIEKKENILFIGSPGVGKTHLATSIGIEAALSRKIAYFITCYDLILQLKRAMLENRLEQKLKVLCKYKVLIIDEVGFTPMDQEGSNLFFQLISKCYEKSSVIMTTNKQLSQWGEIFGDPVLANAILDRVLHHCHVINIVGKSYRTKDYLEIEELENNQN